MNTVIAFPDTARQPARRGSSRADRGGSRPEGAEIVILPVVRIERHVSALPGPTPEAEAVFRPRRSH
ncbi:hypothetical protein [Xanthobacter flavus]|uniref:hypothetical protein n=1 Tax=Xanthobacter flavus TaxID=281 RepID=UPI0037274425